MGIDLCKESLHKKYVQIDFQTHWEFEDKSPYMSGDYLFFYMYDAEL